MTLTNRGLSTKAKVVKRVDHIDAGTDAVAARRPMAASKFIFGALCEFTSNYGVAAAQEHLKIAIECVTELESEGK